METKKYSFGLFWPDFYEAVRYMWPAQDSEEIEKLDKLLENKREAIEKPLLEETRKSMRVLGMKDKYYPKSEIGYKGLTFHIFSGGEWFTLGGMMLGGYFISTHNIDGITGKMVAFNVAARALELLVQDFSAPKWTKKSEDKVHFSESEFELVYPLSDETPLNFDESQHRKPLQRILQMLELKPEFEIRQKNNCVSLIIAEGRIDFAPNLCVAREFKPYNLGRASYLASWLCSLASEAKSHHS
ncbi:hypothetical protein HYW76_03520 [Candidatus Pacearchaeota archaeon]|nr:hypothetical protein [Candidatus Pacearchaeota archaeon]